jgi:hypothetical protein
MITQEDLLVVIKENSSEENPISPEVMAGITGELPKNMSSLLTKLMRTESHLHRKNVSQRGQSFLYWFDNTKPSEYYALWKRGLVKPRTHGTVVAPPAAPAPSHAPIFKSEVIGANLIAGIVFVNISGKRLFCSLANFKEA